MDMSYCRECGHKLEMKFLENEGMVPYCPACNAYRFPLFNVACSMVVLSPNKDEIVLIKQYNKPDYVLVAGYVNQKEDAEDCVVREIKEELGADVTSFHFNRSHYFAKTNTLMLNFTAVLASKELCCNEEVDSYAWFTLKEAREQIKKNSLAQAFLLGYLDQSYSFD